LDAARRLRRIYRHSAETDLFLRPGFRVAGSIARGRLNHIASCVVQGIHLAERSSPGQSLEASSLDPKRATWYLFGLSAGSVFRDGSPLVVAQQPSRWSFVQDLGSGFGSGYARLEGPASKAFQIGRGLYGAYWHWHRYVEEQSFRDNDPSVDRGVGAMIWPGSGLDAVTAASIAHSFSSERGQEIWKGLGFALSFLAELCEPKSETAGQLLGSAGPMARHLIEGVTFGAFQRDRIQDVDAQVELVCRQVAGESAAVLARASQDRFSDWQ
jgi:hypothetical protein